MPASTMLSQAGIDIGVTDLPELLPELSLNAVLLSLHCLAMRKALPGSPFF
jgi:hypothetical protein